MVPLAECNLEDVFFKCIPSILIAGLFAAMFP